MSNKFRITRLNAGLNQEQAAKKLGIHVTTLNKYENNHRDPSANVLRKMATLYKVSHNELLGSEPRKAPASTIKSEESMYRKKYEDKCEEVIELQKMIIDLSSKKDTRVLKKSS
jgi:transcriptional regulator with XRE-family HTH domain